MKFRDDDTFLVSYPKSGNTWMRFLLANLIARPPTSFRDANRLVPDIHNAQTPEIFDDIPSPRIIKSHFPFQPQYRKVIYLVRDPRSVCLSQFFFKKRRAEISTETSFETFFGLFLEGFDDGFSDWGTNVTSWLSNEMDSSSRMILRYEDLRADTRTWLSKVCRFADIDATDQNLLRAIRNSSMEAMRKLELETGLGAQLKGKGDLSIPFVRRGSTTEWSDYFTPDMDRELKARFTEAMKLGGYT